MTKILIMFLSGIITSVIALTVVGIIALNGSLIYILNEIPLFSRFVDINESIVSLETGNPAWHGSIVRNFLIIIVIAIILRLTKNIIDWIVNSFSIQKPSDKFVSFINRGMWKFLVSMISVLFIPALINNLFEKFEEKIGSSSVSWISGLIAVVVITVSILFGLFINKENFFIIFIGKLLIPVTQVAAVIAIYSFIYSVSKTHEYQFFLLLIFSSAFIFFVLEWIKNKIVITKKAIKEE